MSETQSGNATESLESFRKELSGLLINALNLTGRHADSAVQKTSNMALDLEKFVEQTVMDLTPHIVAQVEAQVKGILKDALRNRPADTPTPTTLQIDALQEMRTFTKKLNEWQTELLCDEFVQRLLSGDIDEARAQRMVILLDSLLTHGTLPRKESE